MSILANTQVPKTSSHSEFEKQVRVLYRCVLNDPNVKLNGTSGQSQNGVDLYGRRKDIGSGHWVGIQCKQTSKRQLPDNTVKKEANLALSFKPALKEFFIVTQAEDNAKLDEDARLFTEEQEALGRQFEVQVIGWGQLQSMVIEHEAAIKVFLPDFSPHYDSLLRGQEKIYDQSVDASENLLTEIQQLKEAVSAGFKAPAVQTTQSTFSLGTVLDGQIDQYRDLMNKGKPKTAMNLLEGLWEGLPADVEPRIKYRVQANIAASLLRLGREQEAGEKYLEAYALSPCSPKSDALKVLGLILLGKPKEAYEFGVSAQNSTNDLEALVSNTITALKFLPKDMQSLEFIPKSLLNNPSVTISKIDFLRSIGERESWREEAYTAFKTNSEDELIKRFYAEAVLDEVFDSWDKSEAQLELDPYLPRINAALEILENEWLKAKEYETAGDSSYLSLAVNLINTYRIVGLPSKSESILKEALDESPNDPALLEKGVMIAIESGDNDKAAKFLKSLPITRDTALAHLIIAVNTGNWETALNLPSSDKFQDFSFSDIAFYDCLQFLARFKVGGVLKPKYEAQQLQETYSGHLIAPLIFYQIADEVVDGDWGLSLYEYAKSIQSQALPSNKLMLAELSEKLGDYENIITLFEGKIKLDQDSHELHLLARAYVNTPIRQSAVEFCDVIEEKLVDAPFYTRIAASIRFNYGQLEKAENCFLRALLLTDNDVAAHMGYISALLRQDKKEKAKLHLAGIKLVRLEGSPRYKMAVAQHLVAFGEDNKGLSYGYRIALENQDDENVQLLYVGLILPDSSKVNIPDPGRLVGEDCWVRVKDQDSKEISFVIEAGANRPSIGHYNPAHENAKLLLGNSIGDVVEQDLVFGTKKSLEIVEVKHKYLALLHQITESFQTKFPGSNKLYSYSTERGDVQPILNDIKKMSEREKEVFDLYTKQNLPLSVVSGLTRHNDIDFANRIIDQGGEIRTCIGTNDERQAAINLCDNTETKGVSLDTYSIWTAYTSNLIPILKDRFNRVVIAQSTMDDLYEWRSNFEAGRHGEMFTIGYENGQFFKQEITVNQVERSYKAIDDAINYIAQSIEVLPSAPLNPLSDFEQELQRSLGSSHIFDPAYIAQREQLILLSEDMAYRTLAKHITNVDGTWLQAALISSEQANVCDFNTYSLAASALASRKHGHVTLDSDVLLSLCRQDHKLEKYQCALSYIGNQNADVASHLRVSGVFMWLLWKEELPQSLKYKATSMILEKIATMAFRNEQLKPLFLELLKIPNRDLVVYLKAWAKGHFIVLG